MDPLGFTASIVAVAGLAVSSSKLLYETLCCIRDAPETLLNLRSEVKVLQQMILSFQQGLEQDSENGTRSEAQELVLNELKPVLQACRGCCDKLHGKIVKLLSNSQDGHISLRDRIKLQFQNKEIEASRALLASFKSTLTIALDFSIRKSTSRNLEATKALESKIEDAAIRLTAQMQGLQIGLQAISDAGALEVASQPQVVTVQQSQAQRAIEQQSEILGHCYRSCMAAFEETAKETGHTYNYVQVSNEAKILMGNLGDVRDGPQSSYSNLDVRGGWVVAGNMDGNAVRDFFK